MQSVRQKAAQLARLAVANTRGMGTHPLYEKPVWANYPGFGMSAEAKWAKYFPHPKTTPEKEKKAFNREMIGFLLLGPVGAAFMIYDYIWGLEEGHSPDHVIPPYPWMRDRKGMGYPWGPNGLFEKHVYVASEWPPAGGLPEKGHGHH